MNAPSVIALTFLLIGLVAPVSFLTYLVFTLSSFAAMSVLPPDLLGGTSVPPTSLASLFFVLRGLLTPDIARRAFSSLLDTKKLGWLGLFFAVATIGSALLPRMFAGEISVYGLRTPILVAVEPSVTNITQMGYLFLSIMMAAFTYAQIAKNPGFLETFLKAVLIGGCMVIATGLVDIVAHAVGLGDSLEAFHSANYATSAGTVLGARRVLGLTPEPAAFGGMATAFCALLLFLRPVYPPRLWRWKVPLVAWGCGVFAFLSTSSTAYVAMFVVLTIYVFYSAHAISEAGVLRRKPIIKKLAGIFSILCILLVITLLDSSLMSSFVDMVNVLIFEKQETSSYVERSSWTAAGIDAFVNSYGLGVGIGSVRTSNFFANILASTGVPGILLFLVFLATLYLRRVPDRLSREAVTIKAIKLSLLPMFAGMFLSGTTPDFGAIPGVLFGIIAGLAANARQTSRQPPGPFLRQPQT